MPPFQTHMAEGEIQKNEINAGSQLCHTLL